MKKLIFILIFFSLIHGLRADHITGGEMFYHYIGKVNGQVSYQVSIKLFMTCNKKRTFNNPDIFSIFYIGKNARLKDISVPLINEENLNMANNNSCINNTP